MASLCTHWTRLFHVDLMGTTPVGLREALCPDSHASTPRAVRTLASGVQSMVTTITGAFRRLFDPGTGLTRTDCSAPATRERAAATIIAERFANHWIHAWNTRDLDAVLAHYADDFEMCSPLIVQMLGLKSGVLAGKAVVAAYWRRALRLLPEFRFELVAVLTSPRSITILYKGVRGRLVAEVFRFNAAGKVCSAIAHYATQP